MKRRNSEISISQSPETPNEISYNSSSLQSLLKVLHKMMKNDESMKGGEEDLNDFCVEGFSLETFEEAMEILESQRKGNGSKIVYLDGKIMMLEWPQRAHEIVKRCIDAKFVGFNVRATDDCSEPYMAFGSTRVRYGKNSLEPDNSFINYYRFKNKCSVRRDIHGTPIPEIVVEVGLLQSLDSLADIATKYLENGVKLVLSIKLIRPENEPRKVRHMLAILQSLRDDIIHIDRMVSFGMDEDIPSSILDKVKQVFHVSDNRIVGGVGCGGPFPVQPNMLEYTLTIPGHIIWSDMAEDEVANHPPAARQDMHIDLYNLLDILSNDNHC